MRCLLSASRLFTLLEAIQMGSLLALLSSVCYGTADFLSGYSARRTSIGYVVTYNQLAALVITALLAFIVPGSFTGTTDVLWSCAAGISVAVMLPALYMALGIGPMSVVAPITALIAIVLPVLFGILIENEKPSIQAYIGFLIGGLAIIFISAPDQENEAITTKSQFKKGIILAVIAGAGIAAMYICLKQVSNQAGLLSLAVSRLVSVLLLVTVSLLVRKSALAIKPNPYSVLFIIFSGGIDAIATALYKLALTHSDQISIIATLASLYPLTTVLLATIILREKLTWKRFTGVALAVSGIALIVSGS